ncbi:MAG: RNA polymerase-binding protein DksA [Pseudomonadota bacterium]|nr:RNA polymerase-binding protein DksA [Pseudomonadota bacterium]
MSSKQISHFKTILLEWKKQLMREADKTVEHMKQDSSKLSDPNDAATQEEEFRLELRTRDRERKLISKIDQALQRVEDGSYGYCEETGDPIGIKRLEARPIATLCIEAQERHEKIEKTRID